MERKRKFKNNLFLELIETGSESGAKMDLGLG